MGNYANRSLMVLIKVSWPCMFSNVRACVRGSSEHFSTQMCVSDKPLRSLLMVADPVKCSFNPGLSCDKQGVRPEGGELEETDRRRNGRKRSPT